MWFIHQPRPCLLTKPTKNPSRTANQPSHPSKMKTTYLDLHSSFTDPPPAYELQSRPSTDNPFSSLHRLSTSSSHPPFTSLAFLPTHNFQIETPGRPLLSLPFHQRPGPIPIFSVPGATTSPSYLSLRPVPSSGSSFLVSPTPDDPSPSQGRPLSTTTYRFGPGRPPVVRLFRPGHGHGEPARNPLPHHHHHHHHQDNDSDSDDELALATFPLTSPSLFTRSVTFSCPALDPEAESGTGSGYGSFTWRYAPSRSADRQTLGFDKSGGSVLVLEYVPAAPKRRVFDAYPSSGTSFPSGGGGGGGSGDRQGGERTVVAVLVRNDEFRSRGTSASAAGNGGRVMVDMGFFSGGGEGGGDVLGEEERREVGVVMVLTTALVMLKREVDRRIGVQRMCMGGLIF
ncbi:hypothetical protein B0T18DRAFT_203899 [Schizothecium vesticola]|uniref:Uncharacterized protein n=1 Tax=Schizothecium vesticola TaxID=314040 RepID=A0AA40EIY7_9PEZI|nr:hypothetical protein B0T18DRAFT_203899 [Schizothecium vesticola]